MPRGPTASASTRACSGWPCVVRSPARSSRSASPARPANALAASVARAGSQWMSPAAAMRSGGADSRWPLLPAVTPRGYPLRCQANVEAGTAWAMGEVRSTFEDIEPTLKKAAAALREAGLEFALAGSVAAWARGAPQSRNDLDFLVRAQDAERALEALCDAGMRAERPPEGWLLKAWDPEGADGET